MDTERRLEQVVQPLGHVDVEPRVGILKKNWRLVARTTTVILSQMPDKLGLVYCDSASKPMQN